MATTSIFYKANMFGAYPKTLDDALLARVDVFVDLTQKDEIETRYVLPPDKRYIAFPIPDWSVPGNPREFAAFILELERLITVDNQTLLIHCRGGHGRSGLVVSVLLCRLENMDPDTALCKTSAIHSRRKALKMRYRLLGSPQTIEQRLFVKRFCRAHVFNTNDILFPRTVLSSTSPTKLYDYYMKRAKNDVEFYSTLAATLIRPLVFVSFEMYWGTNCFGTGRNELGRILERVREHVHNPLGNFWAKPAFRSDDLQSGKLAACGVCVGADCIDECHGTAERVGNDIGDGRRHAGHHFEHGLPRARASL